MAKDPYPVGKNPLDRLFQTLGSASVAAKRMTEKPADAPRNTRAPAASSSPFRRLSDAERQKVDSEKEALKGSLEKLTSLPEQKLEEVKKLAAEAAEYAKGRAMEVQQEAARVAAVPGATLEEVKAAVDAARVAAEAKLAAEAGSQAVAATRVAAEEDVRTARAAAAAKMNEAKKIAVRAAKTAERAAAAAIAVKAEAEAEAAAAAQAAQLMIEAAEAEAFRLAAEAEAAEAEARRVADAPKQKLAAAGQSLADATEAAASAAKAAAEAYEAAKPGLQATAKTAANLAKEIAKSEAAVVALQLAKDNAAKLAGNDEASNAASGDASILGDESVAAAAELEAARASLAEAKAQLAQMTFDEGDEWYDDDDDDEGVDGDGSYDNAYGASAVSDEAVPSRKYGAV